MIFNFDSYYTNGKMFKNCQDYSMHDNINNFAIISDGCSSSRNTDLGARILTYLASDKLKRGDFECQLPETCILLGLDITKSSKEILNCLNAPLESLDATLIGLKIYNEFNSKCFIVMYGDGYIVELNNYFPYKITKVEYDGNAPYYLSYWIDDKKNEAYKELSKSYNEDFLTKKITETSLLKTYTKNEKYNKLTIIDIDLLETSTSGIMIMSDGVDSFINYNTGDRICDVDMINQFTNFKNINGEFIKRRVRKVINELDKENIRNSDDVSIAGFIIPERWK